MGLAVATKASHQPGGIPFHGHSNGDRHGVVRRVLELTNLASCSLYADTSRDMEDFGFVLFMALVGWLAYKLLDDSNGGGKRAKLSAQA